MRGSVLVLACLVLALGFVAGRWSSPEPVPSPVVAPAPPPDPGAGARANRVEGGANETPREAATTAVSPAQLDLAREEARRAWRDVRSQPMPEATLQNVLDAYAEQLRTAAAEHAKALAEQANKKDADAARLRSDDLLAILQKTERDDPGLAQFANAPARFASLFAARVGGATHDGRTLTRDQSLADGATITFPAGVFPLRNLASRSGSFPTDVTVRGAGMDRTLLVADAVRPQDALVRFAIEDCTVFADNGITDDRTATVLALRRVRIVGFDCGAGGSVAIYASGATAVLAQDCRFEGGYGRSPMHGDLIDSRNTLLARFEACTFERMAIRAASAATVFSNCTMTDLFGDAAAGPVYQNCRVQQNELYRQGQWEQLGQAMRRDLNTLFPQWQQQLQAAGR